MSEIGMVPVGCDEVIKKMARVVEEFDIAGKRIVSRGAEVIAANAKKQFRARPAGSVRRSKRTGKVWYDSRGYGVDGYGYNGSFAPERPHPTQRSGNLRNSIRRKKVTREGPGRWMSLTGSGLVYAQRVEKLGFFYLTSGYDQSKPELVSIYREEWGGRVKLK